MLLEEKIVVVGIGQCGGNIARELELLNYNAFYVNSSLEDLDTIKTDKTNKFHIKGKKGMAKDRDMAMKVITEGTLAEDIVYAIHDQYSMADIVFMVYSLSGGTGGTMGNVIAHQMSASYSDKTVNVIAVLPKITEDIGIQTNAIKSLEHLRDLQKEGIITQVHLLDNNSRDDIFSINKDFATCFDRFISFDEITETGNLDEEEREKLLMVNGMGVILEFSNDDFGNGLEESVRTSIYADWLKNSKLHGVILNKKQDNDLNLQLKNDVLGMPVFTHKSTWSEDSNVLFAVGMDFNENIFTNLKKNAKEMFDKKQEIEEEIKNEKAEEVDFDISKVKVNNFKNKTTKPINDVNTSGSRRRRGKSGSSIADRYRNM